MDSILTASAPRDADDVEVGSHEGTNKGKPLPPDGSAYANDDDED